MNRLSSPTTLYIAGPMTGLPDNNYPAFDQAAVDLAEAGYAAYNPVRSNEHAAAPRPFAATWPDYMRNGINQLIRCDDIALLPGWELSRGAMIEYTLAVDLELDTKLVSDWIRHAQERAA